MRLPGDTLRKVGIEHPLALEAIWYFRERIDEWSFKRISWAQLADKLERS